MIRTCFALVLLAASAAPAWALESVAKTTAHVTAALVSETDSYRPGQSFRIGLRLQLAPGWHTYWQNPGDAGQAPDVAVSLPPGAKAGPIEWPAPRRMAEGSLVTFGYTGTVLLPMLVSPPPGDAPLSIDAEAHWLVCETICVPEQARFHLALPPGNGAAGAQAPLFAQTDAAMPRPSPFAARIAPDGTLSVIGEGLSSATVRDAWFIPATAGVIDGPAPQRLAVDEGSLTLHLKPADDFKPGKPLQGVLVLQDPSGATSALSMDATPGPALVTPVQAPLWRIVAFALLGGLILNLMPCVFPVLAMKAIAIARLGGRERREVRLHAACYTAGALVAFGALGTVLILLHAAGAAAGWGFQFASPVFAAAMCWLLFAIGLNLSGVVRVGVGLAGAGQSLANRDGHVGSFFTGLLAVLVATPCTAPFMAAAIAAAVAAPPPVAIGIFLAMGLGLAAPYALLALAPRLAGFLPRPGTWMELLRQALAFPMYAGAVWLLWVVSQESGPGGVLGTAAGLLLIGFAAWVLGTAQRSAGRSRRIGRVAAAAAALAAVAVLPGVAHAPPPTDAVNAFAGAEPFSATRLAALRAAGRPVFVNMTAAWCVTCLLNERVALSPPEVRAAFTAHHVAYLRGDWTRQDPSITTFLRAHGRDGVPLYVYFPASGSPDVLPQILTANRVLQEIDGTGG